MIQASDIKLNHGSILDLPVAVLKSNSDSASGTSFFNILTSQINTPDQNMNTVKENADQLKNNNAHAVSEKEKPSQETVQSKNNTETDTGKPIEQMQKQAINNRPRETKNAESIKSPSDTKINVDVKGKIGPEKIINNKTLTQDKQKSKKIEDADRHDLFDRLHNIIDVINMHRNTNDAKQAHQTLKEMDTFASNGKLNVDRFLIKKTLDKLSAVLEKMNVKNMPASTAEHISAVITNMKKISSRMKGGLDKNQNQKSAETTDSIMVVLKDILSKLEAIGEGLKGDSARNNAGKDSHNESDTMTFSFQKGDMSMKRLESSSAAQHRSNLFNETLEQIMHNARVIVKDSKNGSFSVRLYPRELGSVNVSLDLHEGVVHGKFLVETQEARDLLLDNIQHLKDRLHDAGIAVGEFQVDVNGRGEHMLSQKDQSQHAFIPPAAASEFESEFKAHAAVYHDGLINMVV